LTKPKRLVFDIETDGLLPDLTKIHSLCIADLDSDQRWSCADQPGFTPIEEGLQIVNWAEEVWGHNILAFDIPAIRKVWPGFREFGPDKARDTLLCSRLMWTDIEEADWANIKAGRLTLPPKLVGAHSLKAWGYRLGVLKGTFSETESFTTWSPSMQEYCEQDVRVSKRLVELVLSKGYSQQAIGLEHDFAEIIYAMSRHGFAFNRQKAVALYEKLVERREELKPELAKAFPPDKEEMKTPAYYKCGKCGCEKGTKGAFVGHPCGIKMVHAGPPKIRLLPFNPGSRQQIADRLKRLGWQPEKFTDSGQAQIDDAVLESLPYPEAKTLAEYFLVQKRIGQAAEGDNAWLKLERNGRIHGELITNGAVSGRCSHHHPNMAQVPRVGSPYGHESRDIFEASPGMVLVGADASGLELRCLSHYLAAFDGGDYARIVCTGDVHTANQGAFGLPPGKEGRNLAKAGIYALIYGAGNWKLGKTLFPDAPDDKAELIGREKRAAFETALPAYKRLVDSVQAVAFGPIIGYREGRNGKKYAVRDTSKGRGYLVGLDGRRLRLRSEHAALNTLLQSAGALLVKRATVIWDQTLSRKGLVRGKCYSLVAHVHDEIQAECRPELAEVVGKTFTEAIAQAGREWNFRCDLTGEFKVGKTWAETH